MSTVKRESKYSKLDEAILARLSTRDTSFFHEIASAEVNAIAEASGSTKYPAQIIDRRLQALKKKGLIVRVLGSGWALAEGDMQ